jgi:CDP-paratose 2-epimerase
MSAPRLTLITGGAGFIGANLASRLLAAGESVRILDNLSRPSVNLNLDWLLERHESKLEVRLGDVRDPSTVNDAVRDVDAVFHLAAQVAVTTSVADPVLDFDVNARGTLNVLEAARTAPRPPSIFLTSTNKVYGALEDVALDRLETRYQPKLDDVREHGISEGRPLDLYSPYGCSKGTADQYVLDYGRTYGLSAAVFRMSCIYGPRQFGTEDQGWLAHFFIRAMRGQRLNIYGDGLQVRDVLYIDDLVDAFLAARESRAFGSAFNIGGGAHNALSLLELLEMMKADYDYRPEVAFLPARVGDQRYYVSDTRRFTRTTGWRPRIAIDEGVSRLHGWLKNRATRTSPAITGATEDRI